MKSIFNILIASTLVISCGENDNTLENPKPIEKVVYDFQYKNYHVKSVVLYKGPTAQPSNPNESYLSKYWGAYQEPIWNMIKVDMKNNSIKLISGTSADAEYKISLSKDSVFIIRNGKPEYIGMFNKTEPSFTLKRALRYVKKMPRNNSTAFFLSQNNTFGTFEYHSVFGYSAFNNPSEMTETGDEVLWGNIEYNYD